jgi:hypothetical protein
MLPASVGLVVGPRECCAVCSTGVDGPLPVEVVNTNEIVSLLLVRHICTLTARTLLRALVLLRMHPRVALFRAILEFLG